MMFPKWCKEKQPHYNGVKQKPIYISRIRVRPSIKLKLPQRRPGTRTGKNIQAFA